MTKLIKLSDVLRVIDSLEEPDGMLDLRSEELIDAITLIPAVTVPRADIDALAMKMRRVHPNDIGAAGYNAISRGGKYENPRAAWYADQIENMILAAQLDKETK